MRRAFSTRDPCIFQFPATIGRRMDDLARLPGRLLAPQRARDDSDAGGVTQRARARGPIAAPESIKKGSFRGRRKSVPGGSGKNVPVFDGPETSLFCPPPPRPFAPPPAPGISTPSPSYLSSQTEMRA